MASSWPGFTTLFILVLAGTAGAVDASEESAEALFAGARRAERAGLPQAEHDACVALQALYAESGEGSAGKLRACEGRLEELEAYRDAAGSLDGLEALEALRRQPERPAAERALEVAELRARPGQSPRLDRELALWLARHAADEGELQAALALTSPLVDSLDMDSGTDQSLARLHVGLLVRAGRDAEAETLWASFSRPASARPQEGPALERQIRRRTNLDRLGVGLLGAYLVLCGPLAALGWSRSAVPLRPRGLGALGLIALPTLLLAGLWDASTLPTLTLALGGVGLVHLVAVGLLERVKAGRWRGVARLATGLATAAVLWLVLHAGGLAGYLGL